MRRKRKEATRGEERRKECAASVVLQEHQHPVAARLDAYPATFPASRLT